MFSCHFSPQCQLSVVPEPQREATWFYIWRVDLTSDLSDLIQGASREVLSPVQQSEGQSAGGLSATRDHEDSTGGAVSADQGAVSRLSLQLRHTGLANGLQIQRSQRAAAAGDDGWQQCFHWWWVLYYCSLMDHKECVWDYTSTGACDVTPICVVCLGSDSEAGLCGSVPEQSSGPPLWTGRQPGHQEPHGPGEKEPKIF